MGTSMSFFFLENRGLSQEALAEDLRVFRAESSAQSESRSQAIMALLRSFMSENQKRQFEEFKQTFAPAGRESRADNVIAFPGAEGPRRKEAALAYREDARWLPLFEENLCEGRIASSRDTKRLARLFGAPVLAFSIFDSDVLYVSYSDLERELELDFIQPNCAEMEEMVEEPYRMEFPGFLCAYGDESALREAWEGEEVFADDRMGKLCSLIGAQPLYDGEELPEGFCRLE